MALNGNHLVITNSEGESHGYVLCLDKQFGEPVIHSKAAPNVPMNLGSSTPAQAGGQYDVRDSDGDKAISHIDWTLGAGQRNLDADGSSPFRYWDSKCIDISKPGEISLLRDVSYTQTDLVTGPVFSAMGYFWLGTDYLTDDNPQVAHSVLMHSQDGITWTHPTITASPAITGLISCFASDGSNVYFGVATGANKGIWRGVYSGTWTFSKYGNSGTTEEVRGLAVNGGQLFAAVVSATASRVAQVDRTTGVIAPQVAGSSLSTPVMFNTVTHVALTASANSVYWVVSQGSKSFIYRVTYDPDTGAMMTEQYMEMPTGFIATCALGYLSSIYVGGYFESQTAGVGKGGVYVCADGYSAPLFELGEIPEHTAIPADSTNDNRINAICEAGKDLYVATNRGAYRWDIDGGGFSHAYDLNSGGAGVSTVTWNPGSEYSYDGTDMTNPPDPGPEHGRFPSKWAQTDTPAYLPLQSQWVSTRDGIVNDGVNCKFWFDRNSTNEPLVDWSNVTYVVATGGTFRFVGDAESGTSFGGAVTIAWDAGKSAWCATKPNENILTQTWSTYGAKVSPSSLSAQQPFQLVTWGHTSGIATLLGGDKTTLTTTPDGADALDNATGSTMEIVTGPSHGGNTRYEVQDGTKTARVRIEKDKVLLQRRIESVTNTGVHLQSWTSNNTEYFYYYVPTDAEYKDPVEYPDAPVGKWLWSDLPIVTTTNYSWAYDWTGTGDYYWADECSLPGAPTVADGYYDRYTAPPLLTGQYQPYLNTAPDTIIAPHPMTVRTILKGNVAEMSVNGALDTKKTINVSGTAYNTATKQLKLAMSKLSSIDSWKLNSSDGVPAQNELEVLGYAGIAYNKGALLSPYMVPSDSTTGIALSGSAFAESGTLTQSETSFHSGTLKKDFRSINVAHSELPDGCAIHATAWIDGSPVVLSPTTTGTRTRFPVNRQGYSIKTALTLQRGSDASATPVVKAINVMWDFVKTRKHQYNLHCAEGANSGTWRDDPQDAISFLYTTADEKATFEDAFVGQYEGAITDVTFLEANPSALEGFSGVMKVMVRESDA